MTINEMLNSVDWDLGSDKHFTHEMFEKDGSEYVIFEGCGLMSYVLRNKEKLTVLLDNHDPSFVIGFLRDHVSDIVNFNQGWMEASNEAFYKERLFNEINKNSQMIRDTYGIPSGVVIDIVNECLCNICVDDYFNKPEKRR